MKLLVANVDDTNKLWHQWLGHINFGTLQHMSCLRMADELLHIKLHSGVCEECILEGNHQEFFLKERHVSQSLAIIHSDICGPMTIKSLGGAK